MTTARKLVAEGLGTGLLVAAIVGSGIMAAQRTDDAAVALLANTLATGAALVALILAFAPVSGAHYNPVVTLAALARRELSIRVGAGYVAVQCTGGILGAILANVMFDLDPVAWSTTARAGAGVLVAEVVATFALVTVILATARTRPTAVPYAVAAVIVAAFWFTSSTSFANPAVTVARCFTDTFAGIRPTDVGGFVLAEIAGAGAAAIVVGWLFGAARSSRVSA